MAMAEVTPGDGGDDNDGNGPGPGVVAGERKPPVPATTARRDGSDDDPIVLRLSDARYNRIVTKHAEALDRAAASDPCIKSEKMRPAADAALAELKGSGRRFRRSPKARSERLGGGFEGEAHKSEKDFRERFRLE